MVIDLNRYRRVCKPQIKDLLDRKTPKQRMDGITEAANYTSCHLVAVCHYFGELYGFTPELHKMIERLIEYYDVREVIGKEE